MIEDLIKNGTGTIIDVRTPAEFLGGHVSGSINIPLQELEQRFEEVTTLHNLSFFVVHPVVEVVWPHNTSNQKALNVTMVADGWKSIFINLNKDNPCSVY